MAAGALPSAARWRRLDPLLDELLDLAPAVRAARLEAVRNDDAALADELAQLLAATQEADEARFLAGVAGGPVPTEPAPTLAGRTLGAWTLLAPLGQGGAGSVWRARRSDGRHDGEAAIKLLHLSLLGRAEGQRFLREGAILARLAHPNIARLLDAGVSGEGQPYLVLELVDGERIDRHCDAHGLRIDERLRLYLDVLAAVAHAHRHLVIHRDIKPSNILVARDGSVKLLDFGIAKLLEDEAQAAEATAITREAGRALTPEYAAPEQLLGEPVTTATDVYALGVLLFQLMAGRHPTSPEGATTPQLVRATLEDEPPRLSQALRADADALAAARSTTPAALVRRLRGDLDNVVAKALRKAAGERYASVEALAEDLRHHLAHEPVRARPDALAYRASKFVRRHRGAVAAAALTGLAIVGGLAGTFTQARRAEAQAHRAEVERDRALHDAAFANGASDLLSYLVGQVNAKPQTAAELLARAEQLTERQFAGDALTRGRMQLMIGIEYGDALESEKSKAVLLKARASANASGDQALLSNVDCLLAATMSDQGQPQPALALFADALRRVPADSDITASTRAACLQMRADVHAHLGQPAAMLADAQAALAALGSPRPDQRLMANSLRIVVAEAYGRLGRMRQAIDAYEQSLADYASMGREQSSRMAIRLNNYSRMLYEAGQTRRAAEVAAHGMQVVGDTTENNEILAVLEGNAVRALVDLGRYDEAKVLATRALASADERNDMRWSGTFALYGAPAWGATGDLARCAGLLATARTRLVASLPANHPMLGTLALAEGRLALAQHAPERARAALREALAAYDRASEKSPLRIRALALLAQVEQQLGDAAAGAADAASAVSDARAVSKDFDHTAWLGGALLSEASVRRSAGDAEGARPLAREAETQLSAALGDDAPASREAKALAGAS
ncbi:MAG: serine/threonine protein kinase [Proteobacteria bacterium]|nr:serine/threonine protein kinase [Pseudomonadota bacterium]